MARFSEDFEQVSRRDLGRRKGEKPTAEAAVAPSAAAPQRSRMTSASVLGLQRSVGNARTAAFLQREGEGESRSPVHNVIGSGGTALDASTRETMEDHLGSDLSDVRLHVDRESAESVQAAAYTVGNDVVLHPDHFQPGTASAQRTLAHELTHVVQQRSGPVEGTAREGGIRVSDPSDRFEREAEASAESLMSTQRMQLSQSPGGTLQRITLQREGEDETDETDVQEIPLQREGEDEMDEDEGTD